jgi:hypothetical protein
MLKKFGGTRNCLTRRSFAACGAAQHSIMLGPVDRRQPGTGYASRWRWRAICALTCAGAVPPSVLRACREARSDSTS